VHIMKNYLIYISIIILLTSNICFSQCWQKISKGLNFTIAIKSDGSLWAWGSNSSYQLGDGTNINKNIPTQIGFDTDWQEISSGQFFSLAIKTNGTLWAWGDNVVGQLGNGTTIYKTIPTQIGTEDSWIKVSSGSFYSLAIKNNGTLWAWGHNQFGQLGNGTNNTRLTPTQIGLDTNWSKISAGFNHALAIKYDGTLWAWGKNSDCELGDGTAINKNVPVQIGSANDWSQISGGNLHTKAIKNNGTLWTWGSGLYGLSGNNSTQSVISSPSQIGSSTNWIKVSSSYDSVSAIKNDGSLWTWGKNDFGQLGDGTFINKGVPTLISTATNCIDLATGVSIHGIVNKINGELWAWGVNFYGQLGDGTNISNNNPINITCSNLSIDENSALFNEIKIYPNPSNDFVTIETPNEEANKVVLYDIFLIKSYSVTLLDNKIDISDLPQGVYIIKISTDSTTYFSKIVKK
jgi:alpha-tubulin suppressor-like RCC1 family protein